MNIVDVINNITDFSSSIWQIHPFREGNTRTTAIFIEKYLVSLGYNVDNTLFKDKSVYFRNALVRSNYFNNYLEYLNSESQLKNTCSIILKAVLFPTDFSATIFTFPISLPFKL